ncbi:hypothetical protein B0T21DRAFT_288110 [Apiosordaria backusii]|uniref:TPR repeat-containing protein n=1 Tax=Apiosordaria backusii TaxID=314023 RepID=A0AA40EHN5_9PEZI|nr:hypothetical protein B0T21DRAFT_288110 [Apiosordaria backusii]
MGLPSPTQNGHGSQLLQELLDQGKYLEVLLSDAGNALIQSYVNNNSQLPPPQGQEQEQEISHQDRKTVGLAAFNAFLQGNVTGPVLDDGLLAKVEKVFGVIDGDESSRDKIKRDLKRRCLTELEVDGVGVYAHVPLLEFFSLARYLLLVDGQDEKEKLRVNVWHYKLLTEPSLGSGSTFNKGLQWCEVPSLRGEIEKGLEVVGSGGPEEEIEKAMVWIMLGQERKAREVLERARRERGFVYTLTGALGKRTKFQERSTSQLVVLAKSKSVEGGNDRGEVKPEGLKLNDDTLLEELKFDKEGGETDIGERDEKKEGVPEELRDIKPDEQPQLSPLDQIILLAEATIKDAFSPADTLTSEEVLPFAVRVISDQGKTNWQIYTHALLVRSRIEVHRSRTMERGVLQMQAVVDQVVVDTTQPEHAQPKENEEAENGVPEITVSVDGEEAAPVDNKPKSFFPAAKPSETAPPEVRLQYIHTLSSPPRWHLESELAYSWAGVGSLVSAVGIFKRLRLWAEVALCYASNAAREDEDGRGKDGEAKAKAILRWRLFNKTRSAPTDSEQDPDEEVVNVENIKETDYHGPERQPAPPNAPRLWCLLGDLENEPKYYERAWEISGQRYARAQKSLGEYYLQQKDLISARDAYKKAVHVNRLSNELWNRLGDISLRLGEFSDAAEAFGRAISSSDSNGGEDARTWSNLGSAFYSLYLERVKELKQQKQNGVQEEPEAAQDDEDEEALEQKKAKDPKTLLTQSLNAYKKGATISHDNWRIWDNVITLASRLRPIAVQEVLLGLQHVVRIKNNEDAIDIDVLRLLLNEAVLSVEKPADSKGIYEPPRGSAERAVVQFLETSVVPLITARSEFWELITRERVWKRDFAGAVDAAEKAWRAAMGGASGGGGLLPGSNSSVGPDGKSRNWLEDKEAWATVVERTDELVSVLENYGEKVPEIGSKWKGKARLAVRSVMGKGKEAWEDTEEWDRLKGLLDGLR